MLEFIARLIEPLLWLLSPARGRHRLPSGTAGAVASCEDTGPVVAAPRDAVPQSVNGPLVRPYLVAHEKHREEARRQRARRRTLWLAVHGIDLGPRVIHGMEVTA
jgi:hypothetical protein